MNPRLLWLALVLGAACIVIYVAQWRPAYGRDDGRYANSELKSWFDALKSDKGMCCSFADGVTVEDPDWGTEGGRYWVRVDGEKIDVPPEAVVNVPNRFGRPVVWPYKDSDGKTQIRCFMAGAQG